MSASAATLGAAIPGVFIARQKRSIRTRDSFIEAGIMALNETRFADLAVSELAKRSGSSVGSFYARFEDKGAFFNALKAQAIEWNNTQIDKRFRKDILLELGPAGSLDLLVDLLADIFTSRYRGVLRESLIRILDPEDPWEPMRQSARQIMQVLHDALHKAFPDLAPEETRDRLSFCFQLIVGTMQNDLVNDYHVFSSRDDTLKTGLKEAVRRYMSLDATV